MINLLFQPPFPEPTDEAGAILAIGQIGFVFLIMGIYLFGMIYACKVKKSFTLTFLVWSFSIELAFGMFIAPVFPFKPNLPIFFILWQTILFIECALKFNESQKEKRKRKR